MSLLSVHFFRIEHFRSHHFACKSTIETGGISRVTGSALLFNQVQQAVFITVGKDFYNFLKMSAFLTFFPEFLPAPADSNGRVPSPG